MRKVNMVFLEASADHGYQGYLDVTLFMCGLPQFVPRRASSHHLRDPDEETSPGEHLHSGLVCCHHQHGFLFLLFLLVILYICQIVINKIKNITDGYDTDMFVNTWRLVSVLSCSRWKQRPLQDDWIQNSVVFKLTYLHE